MLSKQKLQLTLKMMSLMKLGMMQNYPNSVGNNIQLFLLIVLLLIQIVFWLNALKTVLQIIKILLWKTQLEKSLLENHYLLEEVLDFALNLVWELIINNLGMDAVFSRILLPITSLLLLENITTKIGSVLDGILTIESPTLIQVSPVLLVSINGGPIASKIMMPKLNALIMDTKIVLLDLVQ